MGFPEFSFDHVCDFGFVISMIEGETVQNRVWFGGSIQGRAKERTCESDSIEFKPGRVVGGDVPW